jgi:hypothetical protein
MSAPHLKDLLIKRRIASTARVLLGLRSSAAAGDALRTASMTLLRARLLSRKGRRSKSARG